MKRLKRTSYCDKNRSSYLDEEKQEYVYEFISYDDKGNQILTKQAIAITKDNIEIIKMLDEFDHREDLQLLYDRRNQDKKFVFEKETNDDGEVNHYCGIENIPDRVNTIEKLLFDEQDVSDERYEKFMATLTEDQRNLIYDHIGLNKPLSQISKEMGGAVSVTSLENRWAKIKAKAKKFFI